MKNGKCPAGEYYCYTNKECKPIPAGFMVDPEGMLRKENGASTTNEEWSEKYKKSINCKNPKGFSQRAHCQGRKKKMQEAQDHEVSMAQTQLDKTIENARKLKKKLGTKEKNIPAWVQAKITDTDHNMDAASSYTEEVVNEEGLRDWFGKSKSKDGKKGWVNVVTGDSCASDKPGEGIPKCVSSAKRASMSKKERLAAAAAKRREDPGQQQKSGGAKPTMVKTDRKTRKEEAACPVCGQDPCQCLEGTINEAKDKKGKGSGKKDACYNKVKSRYDVWPSAYASGALVKCRKVGAANWGNKSESLSPVSQKILAELNLDEKCWVGYTQKGMKKKGSKMVPNCVPVSEDMTRINENGQTYAVILTWRGKTYTFQMFIPAMKRPSKLEIETQVRKVYPDARVLQFMPKQYDPTDPTIMLPEAYDEPGERKYGKKYDRFRRPGAKEGRDYGGSRKEKPVDFSGLRGGWSEKKKEEKKDVKESAAWTRKSGKNPEGGLNEKGRRSYERENPGSDLKAPSKKVGNKRRASFCARMSGMKKKLTSAKTANDPNSRINKSLRAWNC